MSLSLISNSQNIARGQTVPFAGTGGTAPYTYSVLPGGAGGTINPTTGLYTAPNAFGIDTVRVTDALLATADLQINVLSHELLVCEIIQRELGLAPGRVYLFDQKINQPKDQNMFIAVQVPSCAPFGNSIYPNTEAGGLEAVQSVNMRSTLSIDVMSRSTEALFRKEEVLMALKSYYSQRQQELNSFFIGTIPVSFNSLSNIDGAAIPYRFNIMVNIQYAVIKRKQELYYDNYPDIEIFSDLGEVVEPIDPSYILLEDSELIDN